MGNLTNKYIKDTYDGLIKLQDSTAGVQPELQPLQDGLGNDLPIKVSTTEVIITGSLQGTASHADSSDTSVSSSYALTASYAENVPVASDIYVSGIQFNTGPTIEPWGYPGDLVLSRTEGEPDLVVTLDGRYQTIANAQSEDQRVTNLEYDVDALQAQTGSYLITGSVTGNVITMEKQDGTTFPLTVTVDPSNLPAGVVSGSEQVILQDTTGDLSGSRISGPVNDSVSSSYAVSASYADNGGVTSIIAGSNVTIDQSTGNVTISVSADTDTTYDLESSQNGADVDINLNGSDASVDTVKLVAGANVNLVDDGLNNITISGELPNLSTDNIWVGDINGVAQEVQSTGYLSGSFAVLNGNNYFNGVENINGQVNIQAVGVNNPLQVSSGSAAIGFTFGEYGGNTQPALFFSGDNSYFQATDNFTIENSPGGQGTGNMDFRTNGQFGITTYGTGSQNITLQSTSGQISLNSPTNVTGNLNVTGTTYIKGASNNSTIIDVTGTTKFKGNIIQTSAVNGKSNTAYPGIYQIYSAPTIVSMDTSFGGLFMVQNSTTGDELTLVGDQSQWGSGWSGLAIAGNDPSNNWPAFIGFQGKSSWTDGRVTIITPLVANTSVEFQSSLDVTGTTNLYGGLNVSGTTTHTGDHTVTGNENIQGSLNVTGTTNLYGGSSVSGTTNFDGGGQVNVQGRFETTGETLLSNGAIITGNALVTGSVDVSGSLHAVLKKPGSGQINIFDVENQVGFYPGYPAMSQVNFSLPSVSGQYNGFLFELYDSPSFNWGSDLSIGPNGVYAEIIVSGSGQTGEFNVYGYSNGQTYANISATNTNVGYNPATKNIQVGYPGGDQTGSLHSGKIEVGSKYGTTNEIIIDATNYIKLDSTQIDITGSINAINDLNVSGTTNLYGDLNVSGTTTHTGNHTVTGDEYIQGSLNVTGVTTTQNNIEVTGSVNILNGGINTATNTNNSIGGNTTFDGGGQLNVNGRFETTGETLLSNGFVASGSAQLTGSLSVSGATYIKGASNSSTVLEVTGNTKFKGNITQTSNIAGNNKSNTAYPGTYAISDGANYSVGMYTDFGGLLSVNNTTTNDEITLVGDQGQWGTGWSGPAIAGNDPGNNWPAFIGFQNASSWTDGRVTVVTPLVANSGLDVTGSLNVEGGGVGLNTAANTTNNIAGSTTFDGGGQVYVNGRFETTGETLLSNGAVITGSVNMANTMTLAPQDPLPTGGLGELAVSSSNELYFHNGTSWNVIV